MTTLDTYEPAARTRSGPGPGPRVAGPPPYVDVVVPVYNEESDLEPGIRRLHAYLAEQFPFPSRITIADNASTDGTWAIAQRLACELGGVRTLRLEQKGRGRALRTAWLSSDSPVVAYTDVDLSSGLEALAPMVAPLLTGHSDVAIGTRLATGARVQRGPTREVLSRGYNVLLRTVLRAHFSDAQCGFKAMRTDTARSLLPAVADDEWFFDTELLVRAQRAGLRIHEVPVDWIDDPDSRVDLSATIRQDLRGIVRLARDAPLGQMAAFAAVGVATTVLHALLFLLFRQATGAQLANAGALVLATVVNTAANRHWTFGVRGRAGAVRHQVQGFIVLVLGLAVTSAGLALLGWVYPSASHAVEAVVIVAGTLTATLLKFVMFRSWVFRPATPPLEKMS
jgi:putative flippase GtrA